MYVKSSFKTRKFHFLTYTVFVVFIEFNVIIKNSMLICERKYQF